MEVLTKYQGSDCRNAFPTSDSTGSRYQEGGHGDRSLPFFDAKPQSISIINRCASTSGAVNRSPPGSLLRQRHSCPSRTGPVDFPWLVLIFIFFLHVPDAINDCMVVINVFHYSPVQFFFIVRYLVKTQYERFWSG